MVSAFNNSIFFGVSINLFFVSKIKVFALIAIKSPKKRKIDEKIVMDCYVLL